MRKAAISKNGVVRGTNLISVTGDLELSVGTPVQLKIRALKGSRKIDRSVFGLWKDRDDLSDSSAWVAELRQTKWRR